MLSASEVERYARQIVLPEIGVSGQQRLRRSRVLVVGAGGLGSPAALYLAAAGVGTLGIVDSDNVELSNLHRQILHATADVGGAKVVSATTAMQRLNPNVDVRTVSARLDARLAHDLIGDWDVVVDGSDNYATRYAINDACAHLSTPWVYGSVERFSGQVSVFGAQDGPCYRCLFPTAPKPGSTASCEEIGVLGAVPGVVGSLQALETLKLILGIGQTLSGRLLQIDFLRGDWRTVAFERRPDCAACGAQHAPSMAQHASTDVEPRELQRAMRLDASATPVVLDVREPWEWNIAHIAGARLVPLDRLERELPTLDADRDLIVYCHHGTRSAAAVEWLRAQGFRARNLVGGIDRWSREIDATIRRY
jgi:adenylyltransferase/sulfurtransferase